jgi:S-adenosylmethionine:tRNA ribosyltransferase-isomerase/non-canonical purine NTP pyrophosphatase (RdgB/HAM1 family)
MSTTTRITFVTGNAGKFATAREHLASLGVELEQVALDLDEIQSSSVQEVALHKAQQAFRALRRPVIVEDSGFYIDELNGYPGPSVKFVIKGLGAEGIARLADQTATRKCHFQGVLVYIDAHGVPRIFADEGDGGTIAEEPTAKPQPGSWSALWDVFVPTGCTEPLSALRDNERAHVFDGWAKQSVFTQFGDWLGRKRRSADANQAGGGRLRSVHLNFEFPADRIASRPRPKGRDLLLVVDRASGAVEHRRFAELPHLLPPRSLLVVNNSQVVKAALRRTLDDGTYLHIVSPFQTSLSNVTCLCPWKPAVGSSITVTGGRFIVESSPEAGRDLRQGRLVPDSSSVTTLQAFMERYGEVPIPIYVNAQREPDDADAIDYQNVYASNPGSVACATAGLHLHDGLLDELRRAGHDVAQITLHIGYGTWKSLATEYVDEHDMDAEFCELSAQVLTAVRAAKAEGRPVVAVGTSSVRTLETFANEILSTGPAKALQRETKLFIAPPFDFRVVDHVITNFAYPQTPIMALTAAFAGSAELLFSAYKEAVDHEDYLFFSYGDGMFLR